MVILSILLRFLFEYRELIFIRLPTTLDIRFFLLIDPTKLFEESLLRDFFPDHFFKKIVLRMIPNQRTKKCAAVRLREGPAKTIENPHPPTHPISFSCFSRKGRPLEMKKRL